MTASARNIQTEADAIMAAIADGRHVEALGMANTLLEKHPADAGAWHLKGKTHLALGEAAAAVAAFNQAIKYKPDFEEACLDLGQTLQAAGQIKLAVKTFEHWLKIVQSGGGKKPMAVSDAMVAEMEAWLRKGIELYGCVNVDEAMRIFAKVLEINPDAPAALLGVGACLHSQRRYADAEVKLLRAIRAKPGYAEALNALGGCYRFTGRYAQAIAAYQQAIASDGNFMPAWQNLARVHAEMRLDRGQTIYAYERALALAPKNIETILELTDTLASAVQWDRLPALKKQLEPAIADGGCAEPFMFAVHAPHLHYKDVTRWAKKLWPASVGYDRVRPLPAVSREDRRLRIGYLSSDFHRHATLALISEMFELHDRTKFEIFGYCYDPIDTGSERGRVTEAMDRFYDVSQVGDPDVANLMHHDGIDILVDLKGYTHGHRLGIAALRPAPIQMHYLGYPATLGANFIDYFITDAVATPEGTEGQFTEALIRLPHSYQINDRKRPLADQALSRAAYGLPETGFVFCDFNSCYKITPEAFALWMRILSQVEGSVLWLYEAFSETAANLKREAEKHGIAPERLIFAPPVLMAEHLQRYALADLVLDTFPVGGHTTTSDALWCGAPVLAMAGEHFAGRVAASLLHAVGLPELVTTSLEEYEKLAVDLARDKKRAAALKQHLEKDRLQFPLFDSAATTRAIEAAYLHAAELHKQGKLPKHFSLTPDLQIAK